MKRHQYALTLAKLRWQTRLVTRRYRVWSIDRVTFPDADTERCVRLGLSMRGDIINDIRAMPAHLAFVTGSESELRAMWGDR